MSKIHTGTLLDRHDVGRPTLVLKTRTGEIVDVRVDPDDLDAAADIWGGRTVRYAYRGGRAFFAPRDEDV